MRIIVAIKHIIQKGLCKLVSEFGQRVGTDVSSVCTDFAAKNLEPRTESPNFVLLLRVLFQRLQNVGDFGSIVF